MTAIAVVSGCYAIGLLSGLSIAVGGRALIIPFVAAPALGCIATYTLSRMLGV